jgi:hypothetical protein
LVINISLPPLRLAVTKPRVAGDQEVKAIRKPVVLKAGWLASGRYRWVAPVATSPK